MRQGQPGKPNPNKSNDIVKWHSQHVNMTYQCNQFSCLSRIGSHSEMLLPHHWNFLQLPPKAFKVLLHNHQSSEQVSNPYTATVWSEEFNVTHCTTRHHRSFTRAFKLFNWFSPSLKTFNMTIYWFGGVSICCVTLMTHCPYIKADSTCLCMTSHVMFLHMYQYVLNLSRTEVDIQSRSCNSRVYSSYQIIEAAHNCVCKESV